MQPNIFTAAAKQVTKLMDKAKVALEERLEVTSPSKKWKIDAKGASAVSNNSKKAKQNPPTDTSKDRPVTEASSSPPDVRTVPEPREICWTIVCTEEEEEAFEAGGKASGPASAEDKRKRLMKEWVSPVYAFFDPTPASLKLVIDVHMNSNAVQKGDARSTGNMHKHVKSCWGEDTLNAADDAKDANEV
ncbi:hypothetical protein EV702DRAFT_1203582 [Suillus placidus]|uniref:Uncharacterized protein n=1 Tax=Suillus placidus TaxID=48579 RepID=A0A9P6ZJD2_9AGAM|nr:hypothetical protein EV702DRAFT_1203582 [Suillus placidus]